MSDSFEEGKLAAANGEPPSANPYTEGEAFEKWRDGWHYFHSENDDGEPTDA